MRSILKRIQAYVEQFVPLDLKKDPENSRRAKGIVVVSLGMFPWWPAFAFQYYSMNANPGAYLTILGASFLLLAAPLIVKWRGALVVATNTLLLGVFVTLVVVAFFDGGIRCQSLLNLPVVPVVAICFAGIYSGLAWTTLIMAAVGGLLALEQGGMAFPRLVPPESADKLLANALLGSLTSLTLAAWYYEKIRNELYALSQKRAQELEGMNQLILTQQQTIVSSSKMAALGEMAGGIAHEINTPLASIHNLAEQITEVLADEPIDVEQVNKMATSLVGSSDRIAKIVKGLRSFSRNAENDPFRPVLVKDLLEETLSLCGEQFKNRGVRLILVPLEEERLSFEGRGTEISQVLLNLLTNSLDALDALADKWIRVEAQGQGGEVRIRVTDSGLGIPPQIGEKIFQPFFTTKDVGKGTGLGLSVSLGIIRNHGGKLWIDSASPNTSFVIDLPKTQAESAAMTAA